MMTLTAAHNGKVCIKLFAAQYSVTAGKYSKCYDVNYNKSI